MAQLPPNTFLADVLLLLKSFQKSLEGDSISSNEVTSKTESFIEKLNVLKNTHLIGGWEELFLQNLIVQNGNQIIFGINLRNDRKRRRNENTFNFNASDRLTFVNSLIKSMRDRLDVECITEAHLKPLSIISTKISKSNLKSCHLFLIPDYNIQAFFKEYLAAAGVLQNCKNPYEYLRKLHDIDNNANKFPILNIALARVLVMKPSTCDVERLISNYLLFF